MPFARRSALFAVFAACACLACGQPPAKEMQDAQAAIDNARTAGAERYAADEFAAAIDALKRADDAAAQRDFRLALNLALDSRARAQTAAAQAAVQRAETRSAAERSAADAAAALDQAQAEFKAAEAARVPARVLGPVRDLIADAGRLVQEARAALQREDYEVAATAATAANAVLTKASGQLAAANAPAGRRRR